MTPGAWRRRPRVSWKCSALQPSLDSLEPLELDLKLLFIVGMPRSGTTLVERILSSHPQVSAGGELTFMQDCLTKLLASRQAAGRTGSIDLADEADRNALLELRESYLDRLFERDLDSEYVTDKLPANFSALGLIRLLFPDARIVHCIRDPVAVCWSLYSAHFGVHVPYNASLDYLVHYYGNVYTKWMTHWRRHTRRWHHRRSIRASRRRSRQ